MAYTLDEFCADTSAALKSQPLPNALPQIAERLKQLLANPAFVAETFSDDMPPGKRELYHDPEPDFYVLAHVQEGNKTGKPHSHGASWAIYGNAREITEMTEWRRVNPESEPMPSWNRPANIRSRPARPGPTALASSTRPHIREGVGHPRHRHRPRPPAALSFRQAGPDAGKDLSGRATRRSRASPPRR